jgi:hypothetical protein
MPKNHPLHPVAARKLAELLDALEKDFGRTPTERKVVNALVYGATPAQTVGMLEAFGQFRRAYNDAQKGDPGAQERSIGGR